MQRLLPFPVLPTPPELPMGIPMSPAFREYVQSIVVFERNLARALFDQFVAIREQINTATQGVGPDIASAPTIKISAPIHRVSGTASIATITAPDGFSGPIWLIATGAWQLVDTGNIALPVGPVAVGQVVSLVYDLVRESWHPVT